MVCVVDGVSSTPGTDTRSSGAPTPGADTSTSAAPTPGADTTGDSRELSADSTNRSGTESETK